ncbi:MAG: hypothetical protein UR89_C0021G0019 [Candidatus Roizmanbacteria bacterium GW2011_GWA2_35_8]|uniref:Uncharacterized protein n=1 Tax=Candidatus Roizmanbacteria bacterium GW2011_GWA2_35_8 TaxID=1618479 RepID=A0A0G0G455_9BACT|nr:MAG: hypothetical protein UR89_C0021G0019 [Candidatus Roizmanbacteria bacterium GW2011_GWA2_35_8]
MNYYINLKKNPSQLIQKLFNKNKTALVPGRFFEDKDSVYARLGFGAVSEKDIKKGIKTMSNYL